MKMCEVFVITKSLLPADVSRIVHAVSQNKRLSLEYGEYANVLIGKDKHYHMVHSDLLVPHACALVSLMNISAPKLAEDAIPVRMVCPAIITDITQVNREDFYFSQDIMFLNCSTMNRYVLERLIGVSHVPFRT